MGALIKVKVKFYPPFSSYVDHKRVELEIEEKATFIDLLAKISEVYPKFRDAIPNVTDECIFYNNMVPFIDGRLIELKQNFQNGDEISLLGSISGG